MPSSARTDTASLPLSICVRVGAIDVQASVAFYAALGLHRIESFDDASGCALLALPNNPSARLLLEPGTCVEPIDLQIEVAALGSALSALGALDPLVARRGEGAHDRVCITDPAGHPVTLTQTPR